MSKELHYELLGIDERIKRINESVEYLKKKGFKIEGKIPDLNEERATLLKHKNV